MSNLYAKVKNYLYSVVVVDTFYLEIYIVRCFFADEPLHLFFLQATANGSPQGGTCWLETCSGLGYIVHDLRFDFTWILL